MASPRNIRRCALQAMYQLDAGAESVEAVRSSLADAPGGPEACDKGLALAEAAWERRREADAAVAALAPEWPTHRQPAIDRTILRLAHYEMTEGGVPPKVVINEAVELAREFSTAKSPMFVNGVLDKIYKARLRPRPQDAGVPETIDPV